MSKSIIDIDAAVELLLGGGIVAVPTETVYGLAAVASKEEAVRIIYTIKQRPPDNPLIVHVNSIEQANNIGLITEKARVLMEAFWPGPLTLVLGHKNGVCDLARAGLPTVAIRMPDHDSLLKIIAGVGAALVAPSANMSGWPSPTMAQHVVDDFEGRVPVVDGGPCRIGLESTVIEVENTSVRVLRPGAITAQSIEKLGFTVRAHTDVSGASPGTRHKHYSPKARVRLFFDAPTLVDAAWQATSAVVLSRSDPKTPLDWWKLEGASLYAELRRADALGLKEILVHCDHAVCLDAALLDRLQRASQE